MYIREKKMYLDVHAIYIHVNVSLDLHPASLRPSLRPYTIVLHMCTYIHVYI